VVLLGGLTLSTGVSLVPQAFAIDKITKNGCPLKRTNRDNTIEG